MHPYSSIDVTAAWKKLRFILSVRSDFHIIDSLLIAVYAFVNLVSMSFSVNQSYTIVLCEKYVDFIYVTILYLIENSTITCMVTFSVLKHLRYSSK